jgi:D-citramalate synthase
LQCYGALKAGVHGLHVTVNGMERAGNAPLESTVAVINDFMPEIEISVKNLVLR